MLSAKRLPAVAPLTMLAIMPSMPADAPLVAWDGSVTHAGEAGADALDGGVGLVKSLVIRSRGVRPDHRHGRQTRRHARVLEKRAAAFAGK